MRGNDEIKIEFSPLPGPGGPGSAECRQEAAGAISALADEVNQLKRRVAAMERAFPVDTWREPDFSGHLIDHNRRIDDAKLLTGYKNEAAKKIVAGGVVATLTLIALGAVEWIKAHIR